jgi:hypothetical protein
MSKAKQKSNAMTPKFRAFYANVWEPRAMQEGKEPFYSVMMVFDKEAQETQEFKNLKKMAMQAAKEKFGEKLPSNLRTPFRKGSEKLDTNGMEADFVFVNAKSKYQPGVVNQAAQDIIEKDEFYSGCYARATVTAYAYDVQGNKGVAFGLQNLQKLGDGEVLGGRKAAKDEFEVIEGFDASSNDDFGDDDFGSSEGESDDDFGI